MRVIVKSGDDTEERRSKNKSHKKQYVELKSKNGQLKPVEMPLGVFFADYS